MHRNRRGTETAKMDGGTVNFLLCIAVLFSWWTLLSVQVPDSTNNPAAAAAAAAAANNDGSSYYSQSVLTASRRKLSTEAIQQQEQHHYVPVVLDPHGRPVAFLFPAPQRRLPQISPVQQDQVSAAHAYSPAANRLVIPSDTRQQTDVERLPTPPATTTIRSSTTSSSNISASTTISSAVAVNPDKQNQDDPTTHHPSRLTVKIPSFSFRQQEIQIEQQEHSSVNDSSLLFLIASGCSVVLVALAAKKGIERARQWARMSQEDTLAYDLAYTENMSCGDASSYGSFVSTQWSDVLDKFDV